MKAESSLCRYFYAASTDIGAARRSNQDEVVVCPAEGFFAVSDGMGGLASGGETSKMIGGVLPLMMREAAEKLKKDPAPQNAERLLSEAVGQISDQIYKSLNRGGRPSHGATLCGVWLLDGYAVFVNLGDSRGYRLGYYKKNIHQITEDHNVAAILVAGSELSKEEARLHPSSSQLTRFVGMVSPAIPETFTAGVSRGDIILLCSDGLYGMVEENRLPKILRSSKSPERVVERLIKSANQAGGRDNIAAVYIKIR
jgi:serine/threonine protein phosphatase PrpC